LETTTKLRMFNINPRTSTMCCNHEKPNSDGIITLIEMILIKPVMEPKIDLSYFQAVAGKDLTSGFGTQVPSIPVPQPTADCNGVLLKLEILRLIPPCEYKNSFEFTFLAF
jgi:hypothetical protein